MLQRIHRRPASRPLRTSLVATALMSCGLVGCASTNKTDDAPAAEEAGPMEVTVTGGGSATVDGDTIKVEYPVPTEFNDRIPEWVINPTIDNVTGAVGVAAANDLGRREQLDEARLNARLELASMFELRVQRAGRSELEQDTRVEGGEPANRSRRNTLGVDRNILDLVLAGSRQRALWVDRDTGELFIWMVMDGAVLDRVGHELVRDVSVFTATEAISKVFRPDRRRFEKPTVIVNMPEAPQPVPVEAAPEPPKTSMEELEETLKPIETIPTGSGDSDG